MPRNRPGKKQRAAKREQDQQALDKLNTTIASKRTIDKTGKPSGVSKPTAHDNERKFTSTEVDAIVQAAVTAAVSATVAAIKELIVGTSHTGVQPTRDNTGKKEQKTEKTKSLAERITFPGRK
jgi:hypothetical protein